MGKRVSSSLQLLVETAGQITLAPSDDDRLFVVEADVGGDQASVAARLLAARIETRRGAIVAARADLRAARRLNPRSPIFSRP